MMKPISSLSKYASTGLHSSLAFTGDGLDLAELLACGFRFMKYLLARKHLKTLGLDCYLWF